MRNLSYLTKIKLIFVFCFFVGILFFSLFLAIQNPIVEEIDLQLAGSQTYTMITQVQASLIRRRLTETQDNLSPKALSSLASKMVANAEKLLQLLSPLQRKLFEEALNDFHLLQKTSLDIMQKEDLDPLIHHTFYLLALTDRFSRLSRSLDSSVYRLSHVLTKDLVAIDKKIFGWAINLNFGFFNLFEGTEPLRLTFFKRWNEAWPQMQKSRALRPGFTNLSQGQIDQKEILRNILDAYRENVVLHQGLSLDILKGEFVKLSDSIIFWTRKKTLSSANDVLQASFNLSFDLMDQIQLLLMTQKNFLLTRRSLAFYSVVFGIGIALLMYATTVIRRPLIILRGAFKRLAKGDLTSQIPITTKDEIATIGSAFNTMVGRFKVVIENIVLSEKLFAKDSSKIFSIAHELDENISKQKLLIGEILSKEKEISYTVHDISGALKEVGKTANLTSYFASAGRDSITLIETNMQTMIRETKNSVETLSKLEEKVKDIQLIIKAIVIIADQSNLLSINTAIRATKTGVKGAGFSVVATKIKGLAEEIAATTLKVEMTVREMIEAVLAAVELVNLFSVKIREQVDDATEVSSHLKNLIKYSQEQIVTFEEVNQGMRDQTTSISLIHDALFRESKISAETTQSISQLYEEIESFRVLLKRLGDMTLAFRTGSQSLTDISDIAFTKVGMEG